jgi:hypothetical protein
VWSLAAAAAVLGPVALVPLVVWALWPGRWPPLVALIRRRGVPA